VSATIALGNVVGETENVFLVGVVPLQTELDGDLVALGRNIDRLLVEAGRGAPFAPGFAAPPTPLERACGLAEMVFLLMDLAATTDCQVELVGQGVNHRDTHTMQAARDFVGVLVKLAARMQHRHDHFRGRPPFFWDYLGWDAATVVGYSNGIICVNRYDD